MPRPKQPIELMRMFRAAAREKSNEVASFAHPELVSLPGQPGVDVLRVGDENADTLIFLTSGIHGVELEAGTMCQLDLLGNDRLNNLPTGVAVVLIHAANPWGAVMSRRYTEENVDLCRNFLDFDSESQNPLAGYDQLRAAIDAHPDHTSQADAVLAKYAEDHGVPALYAAVMTGQYRDADGIGYGGQGPTWARQTLERIMLEHAGSAKRIYAVDYHTGVGPYGYGSIIAMQRGVRLVRAQQVFGDWIISPRENPPAGFVDVTGHSTDGYEALFPHADVMAGVLEVGTYPQDIFIKQLLAEHRLTRHHGRDSGHPDLISARRDMVDFFIPNDPHWRAYLLHRGRQIFDQVLEDVARDQS